MIHIIIFKKKNEINLYMYVCIENYSYTKWVLSIILPTCIRLCRNLITISCSFWLKEWVVRNDSILLQSLLLPESSGQTHNSWRVWKIWAKKNIMNYTHLPQIFSNHIILQTAISFLHYLYKVGCVIKNNVIS